MEFTDQELAFFKQLFSNNSLNESELAGADLSLRSDFPEYAASVLDGNTPCLLATVKNFELWFPLSLNLNKNGDITPSLGAPEIFETQGQIRSWRMDFPSNVYLILEDNTRALVESLSSSGAVIDTKHVKDIPEHTHAMLSLPNGKLLSVTIEQTRSQGSLVGLTFLKNDSKKDLRQFLFDHHKKHFKDIYVSLTSSN